MGRQKEYFIDFYDKLSNVTPERGDVLFIHLQDAEVEDDVTKELTKLIQKRVKHKDFSMVFLPEFNFFKLNKQQLVNLRDYIDTLIFNGSHSENDIEIEDNKEI